MLPVNVKLYPPLVKVLLPVKVPSPVYIVVPPPAAAQVPSALKKLVVPPPLAGARPFNDDVNVSSKVVACVPVNVSMFPVDAVTLPNIELVAI